MAFRDEAWTNFPEPALSPQRRAVFATIQGEPAVMTAAEAASFLEELARQEVQLWVEGRDLRFRSPPGVLTSELRTRISANRASLVAYLEAKASSDAGAGRCPQASPDAVHGVHDAPKGTVDEGVRERIAARRDELIAAGSAPASRSVEILSAVASASSPFHTISGACGS